MTNLHWPGVVRENVGLAPDDGHAVGLRAERALEPQVLLVGAAELVKKVPQGRLSVPETYRRFDFSIHKDSGMVGSFLSATAHSVRCTCPTNIISP